MNLSNMFTKICNEITDIIYPKRCITCDSLLEYIKKDKLFCEHCIELMKPILPPFCPICGAHNDLGKRCKNCRKHDCFMYNRSFMQYDDFGKEVINQFKYKKQTYIGKNIVSYLDTMTDMGFIRSADLLVPVPIHENKLKTRGFNQAEVLCAGLSAHYGIPYTKDLLIRNRETVPQNSLTRRERIINLEGSISINENRIEEIFEKKVNTVCVIDDIYTSGSTIMECAKILYDNGINNIFSFTICKTVGKKW